MVGADDGVKGGVGAGDPLPTPYEKLASMDRGEGVLVGLMELRADLGDSLE